MFYKIIIGDSRYMKELKDNSIDLIVTSPPYWLITTYTTKESDELKADISRIADRKAFFYELTKVWKECYRVLKPGKYFALNFADTAVGSRMTGFPRQYCNAGEYYNSVEKAGFYLINEWIWKKYNPAVIINKAKYALYENPTSKDIRSVMNWEYIHIYKKYGESKTRILDYTKDEWIEWSDGIWYIEASREKEFGEYATEAAIFPVDLPKRLIKIYSSPKDVILDPFLGSGTTMLAAKETNRSCVGYEIRRELLPIIKKKVGYGEQKLMGEDINWEIIERTVS